MRHNPQTGVFCGSYINEKVRFVVQDAVLDQPTDAGFLRAVTHMSLTCDPRAPQGVPMDIMKTIPPDPEIVELEKEHRELAQKIKYELGFLKASNGTEIGEEYRQLGRKIAAMVKARQRELDKEYRRQYFYHTHNQALENQRHKVAIVKHVESAIHHQLPERNQLQHLLCDLDKDLPSTNTVARRIAAIDLMVALSRRQEAPSRKSRTKLARIGSDELQESQKSQDMTPPPEYDPPPSYEAFPLLCKKTNCIFCLGNERLSLEERKRTFSRTAHMWDHVDKHIKRDVADGRFDCHHPICKSNNELVLKSLMHFKRHVEDVHGISLRP